MSSKGTIPAKQRIVGIEEMRVLTGALRRNDDFSEEEEEPIYPILTENSNLYQCTCDIRVADKGGPLSRKRVKPFKGTET